MLFTPSKIHSWLEIQYFNMSPWKIYFKNFMWPLSHMSTLSNTVQNPTEKNSKC